MTSKKSYIELKAQLDELLAWFESGEVDVELALAKYAEAEAVLKQIEVLLKSAELQVRKLG